MLVNQKFIADEVGCSQKTVSLYFKNRLLVAEKTRAQLDVVVQKYNYFPNAAARSIKNNRFNRVACLVAQYGDCTLMAHPHLITYINGASTELSKAGYSLIFEQVFIDPDDYCVDFPELFSMRSVDGIIGIPGSWMPPEIDERVAALELPIIWLNRKMENPTIASLLIDEAAGAHDLARYLLGAGYRNIGWFGPEFDCDLAVHYSSRLRFEALRDGMAQGGGRISVPVFVHTGKALGEDASALVAGRNQFDALVCYNFQYREAAAVALMAAGVNPLARKIVHFASAWEHHRYYDYADYVLLPEAELGRRGAQYILSRLNGEDRPELLLPLPGQLHIASGVPATTCFRQDFEK